MPAVYAHDRFSVKVRDGMDSDLKEIAQKYNSAYRDGAQGPDIFFFYHPFCFNWVQKYGQNLHNSDASGFFNHALRVVRKYGRDSAEYAYLLGFICHFTLDGECHPYIADEIPRCGVDHLEIEAEFEKHLLREDGQEAVHYPLADLIYSDEKTAAAIEPFFPSINLKKAHACLRDMQVVKRFFNAPVPIRKYFYGNVMKLIGIYHHDNGLMINANDNPACEESNRDLQEIFDASVPLALTLQKQFDDCLQSGKPLPERFHRDFE